MAFNISKKRMFRNQPSTAMRGQYTFLPNTDSYNDQYALFEDTDGLPENADKFAEAGLYNIVQDDPINDRIVRQDLVYPGKSFVKVDKLRILNTGTGHRQNGCYFRAWIFDNEAWINTRNGDTPGDIGGPSRHSYHDIWHRLNSVDEGIPYAIFFDWNAGTQGRSWSPGTIFETQNIIEQMDLEDPIEPEFDYWNPNFDSLNSFQARRSDVISEDAMSDTQDNKLIINSDASNYSQDIYIVLWMQGNDKRKFLWKYYTDHRRRRMYVFKIKSDELFNQLDFSPKETPIELGHHSAESIHEANGGSWLGHQAPAFRLDEFNFTFSTFPQGNNPEAGQDDELAEIYDKIVPSRTLSLDNIDATFINQNPYQEINNFRYPGDPYNVEQTNRVKENFDPVALIYSDSDMIYRTIQGNTTSPQNSDFGWDFQAYQPTVFDTQVCSAPGKVSLDFDISEYKNSESEVLDEGNTLNTDVIGYKFFVVRWDDKDNEINNLNDVLEDSPTSFSKLLEKRDDDLYYFSTPGTPLHHKYLTPGIKTIKSVLFSHTIEGTVQIVRWKFITSRVFLDIPLSEYPDFEEVGGVDYKTLPWPYTTPIIGGVDENSNYKISVRDTLGGGKIGNTDILDERFLYADSINDEMGQSINRFDLEQVRYFVTGSYDMNKLLEIENRVTTTGIDWNPYTDNSETGYWNCSNWNRERTKCFSDETSVGQIFISDNLHFDLMENCKLELNVGNINNKSIIDTTGNANKGIIFGDYKIKKYNKNQPMKRDSFINLPKLNNNSRGAL